MKLAYHGDYRVVYGSLFDAVQTVSSHLAATRDPDALADVLPVLAAMLALEEKAPGVHLKPLYKEHAVLVARRSHRRTKAPLGKGELAALQHVDVEVAPGRGFRGLARTYETLGIARQIAVVVPSFVAAAAIVAATDFVATLPTSLVDVFGERLGIRAIKAPVPRLTIEVKLAWHDRTEGDPAMRAFRDLVERSVREP